MIKTERVFIYINKGNKMEERAIETLKKILAMRNIKPDLDSLGSPIDETRMFNIGGILIIFSEKGRITENILQNYITFSNENNYKNGTIVVSLSEPSENLLSFVRDYNNDLKNPLFQVFDIRRLQFDITKHRKFPPHRIISKDELSALEKKYNITDPKKQLPWIDSEDPGAKWIGARSGDVIEVQRFSESAGKSTYHRYCTTNVLQT
jgi:DNA-directed RNA polymerase subunit H (RpoH/RPB5)